MINLSIIWTFIKKTLSTSQNFYYFTFYYFWFCKQLDNFENQKMIFLYHLYKLWYLVIQIFYYLIVIFFKLLSNLPLVSLCLFLIRFIDFFYAFWKLTCLEIMMDNDSFVILRFSCFYVLSSQKLNQFHSHFALKYFFVNWLLLVIYQVCFQ